MQRNYNEYDYSNIIEEIKSKLRQPHIKAPSFTIETYHEAVAAKKILAKHSLNDFYDQCDRLFLLDEQASQLLSTDFLKLVFYYSANNKAGFLKIDNYSERTLADAIQDGLVHGADHLELMANHDGATLEEQKQHFEKHSLPILENILSLAEELDIDIDDFSYLYAATDEVPLTERLEEIEWFVDRIGAENFMQSTQNHENNDIESSAWFALITTFGILGLDIHINEDMESPMRVTTLKRKQPITIDDFITLFSLDSHIFTNRYTCEYLFNPVPLTACIASQKQYIVGNKPYRFRDILKALLESAENNKESEIYHQLGLRLKLIENYLKSPSPNHHLPDNALRMIQLLEIFKTNTSAAQSNRYEDVIRRLRKVRDEDDALLVKDELPLGLLSRSQLNQFELASLTNEALLEQTNHLLLTNPVLSKKYCREIEGRLLRIDRYPEITLDIENQLNTQPQKYSSLIQAVHQDFLMQTSNISRGFTTHEGRINGGIEKADYIQRIMNEWNIAIGTPHQDIYRLRDNLLMLEKKLPELKQMMKIDRQPLLSCLHAAFVALGCLAFIGIPITLWAMYCSKRDKGTVFFTHAPETMRISKETEKVMQRMGRGV